MVTTTLLQRYDNDLGADVFAWLLLVGLILFSSIDCALADEPLIIGVEDNRYLPHYNYENNEYSGFGRDVLDAFFTSLDVAYEYRALPVSRLFRTYIEGGVDFKYPDNEIWSSSDKAGLAIRYSDPVVEYIDGVSVLPANLNTPIDSVSIIGTVRGFSAWDWQDRIDAGKIVLSENSSTQKLIEQVLTKRIHGAYANIDVIQYILLHKMDKGEAIVFDDSLPHTRSSYRLSSHKHVAIIEQFNQWMKENSKLVDTIKQKNGIKPLAQR